jgi:hypothetical protein
LLATQFIHPVGQVLKVDAGISRIPFRVFLRNHTIAAKEAANCAKPTRRREDLHKAHGRA